MSVFKMGTATLNATEMLKRGYAFAESLISNDVSMMRKRRMKILSELEASDIKAHGKVFPVSAIPLFFNYPDVEFFSAIITKVCVLLEKITKLYVEDEEYRKIFKLDKRLEKLILIPSNPTFASPVGRIDVFLNRNGLKICEINTDGTGGMSRSDYINSMILQCPAVRNAYPSSESKSIVLRIAYELANHYYKNSPKPKSKPMFAVVDFQEEGVFSDFDRFIACFKKLGADSDFVDIRELDFDGKRLVSRKSGRTIDMIYRRAVSSVVAERMNECGALIEALENNKVMLLGDFKSTLMHSKSISAAVFHPETFKRISAEDRKTVELFFPRTYFFDKESIDGGLLADVRTNRAKWVLKPQAGFASHGVICGRDVSESSWSDSLDSLFGTGYMLQEFCESLKFPALRLDGDSISSFPLMIGIYFIMGQFAGLYNRAGANAIIDFEHDGLFYPSIYTGTVNGTVNGS